MNKSSTIWVIAALCVIIVLTAFGVVTNRMIQKDVQHSQQIVDAHREGRIRLAMWRLDTLAASIVANEDERSVFEFTNPELDKFIEINPAIAVNPLYYRTPDTANLYWTFEPTSIHKVISPQVYNESYLIGNSIPYDNNFQNKGQLEKFKKILIQQNDIAPITNGALMCQAAHVSLDTWGARNTYTKVQDKTPEENQNQDFSYNNYASTHLNSSLQVEKIINAPAEQYKLTKADQGSRRKAVDRITSGKRQESWNNTIQQTKEKVPIPEESATEKEFTTGFKTSTKKHSQEKTIETYTKKSPQKFSILSDPAKKNSEQTQQLTFEPAQQTQPAPLFVERLATVSSPPQQNPTQNTPSVDTNILDLETEEPFSTPFTPLWLNGELMLVRKVSEPTKDSVQGIWLNKEIVINKLLSEINDLFPHAKLTPVKQDINKILDGKNIQGDETTMLSIPLRLIHNDLTTINVTPTDYIFGPIGLAWLGAILAIGAFYYMFRSVLKMAERRASFVSSVTHELRTPLTTFRLYSDLLSSGMVTDQEKQQMYLNTLKLESERLSHLVENVLSYSQIEKGSAKAKTESLSIYELIQRIEPRLNERATEESMIVNTIYSESSAQKILNIDATGVEQIIFNLIDNACKYASAENHGREITLVAEVTNRKLHLKVCDQGDGIARSEQKRLFKPFHKSAKEAAHTKPGVGLGLALCKRLARAMNGDLTIAKNTNSKGACFLLTLNR